MARVARMSSRNRSFPRWCGVALMLTSNSASPTRDCARVGPTGTQISSQMLQQEVLRRVARDGKFRKHHQIGLRLAGPFESFEHQSGVAVEVADGRVHLSQRNP